jgi:hypothetical protein
MPDANPAEERLIADCAQLLTVTLADPAEFPFWDFLERVQEQAADNQPVGRRWFAAINRVREAGRLTVDQAHAIIEHVAYSVISEQAAGDPENHDAILRELLRAFGEEQLARRLETDRADYLQHSNAALKELWGRDDEAGSGWKIEYPSPDTPLAEREAKVHEGGDTRLVERVEQWREATSGEGIWTVDAVLAFALIASYDNLEGEGDHWITSIQVARKKGIIDRNLSYLLLDRVAGMMLADEPGGDPVLLDLREQMDDIPYTDALPEGSAPIEYDPRDREQWEALNAVYEKRRERYKLRILGDAGEVEMVRMMEERPTEFRMRVATAATEWEVED